MTAGPYNLPGPGDEATWPRCTNHPNDPRTPARRPVDPRDAAIAIAHDPARLKRLKADGTLVYAELRVRHDSQWIDLDLALDVLCGHIAAGRYADADVLAADIRAELAREIARLIERGDVEPE